MTQQEALQLLKRGYNVFLTGAAGSGKTYLLNKFVKQQINRGIAIGVTASTGIAATHMNGMTIHSFAGIGIRREASDEEIKGIAEKKRVFKRLRQTKILIIDEISMLDAACFDLVERVARYARGNFEPFGGMQVILCGDFFQLPPVARNGESAPKFAYQSAAWKALDFKICYLEEQHRQEDKNFLKVLNAIREAAIDDEIISCLAARCGAKLPMGKVTKLYSHNANVEEENARELACLAGKEKYYQMMSKGPPAVVEALQKGCLAPEIFTVKKGAAVMFVKNNFEEGYVNGTLGKVVDFDDSGYPIVLTFNGDKIVAAPAVWRVEENGKSIAEIKQIPLRLAWAITIHKSQGMTLDAAEIDLRAAFESGMGYVALSRVRALSGIKLLGFNKTSLEVHPEILDFDILLRKKSDEAIKFLGTLPPLVEEDKSEKAKNYSLEEIRKLHPGAYQKWTSDEEKRLVTGFRAGKTMEELGEMLGRKRGAIRSRLRKLELIKE